MTDTAGCEVIVVVEDANHWIFSKKVLLALGFTFRNIRPRIAPRGRGSANTTVLARYAPEVRAYRKRRANIRPNSGVLAVIDADQFTVEERKRQLDNELSAASQAPREAGESIVVWVPRRNIETWLTHLCGEAVTEEENVKRQWSNLDTVKAGREFVRLFHEKKQRPIDTLPSIESALQETLRIRD